MPRLTDDVLDCTIYLYETHVNASRGVETGGSGFLYEIPFGSEKFGRGHLYAVSNWHVVQKAPVIRLNSSQGQKIIRKKPHEWFRHPDQHTDLAVCLLANDLRGEDSSLYTFKSISPGHLATKERIAELNIGIGDDTFLVGRFVNHDGVQRNEPSVRFGSIAQMPKNKIKTDTGEQEAFLVEVKSISGFSGSPVFALISEKRSRDYREKISTMRGNPTAMAIVMAQDVTELFIFLGIDCGHLIDSQPVVDANGRKTGGYIHVNTGMAIVIVPWKLTELLENPTLKRQREEAERERKKQIVGAEDYASKPTQRSNAKNPADRIDIPTPNRKEFLSDLRKATRRKKSSE